MQLSSSVDINKAQVAVAAVLFGTSGVAVQTLAPGLAAVTTAGWRVVLGAAVLVGLSATRGHAPWRYSPRWRVTLPGGLAFLVFQLGFFVSVSLAGVATATIVTIGTGPVVAGLLDRARRGTPLRARWWTGVGVAVVGIALTTGAGTVTVNPAGMASAVIAGSCFPVFGSAIRDLTADRPALTAVATVFGAAILPAATLLAIAGSNPAATPGIIIALLYLGVVTTAIAYALWSAGLARLTLCRHCHPDHAGTGRGHRHGHRGPRRTRRADDHPRHHHHPFRSMDRLHRSEQAVRSIGIVKGERSRGPRYAIHLRIAGQARDRRLGGPPKASGRASLSRTRPAGPSRATQISFDLTPGNRWNWPVADTFHDDELRIDVRLVRALVDGAFPEFASLPLSPHGSSGSSNALFRLGEELLVRLPRQPGGSAAIEKEARWLPQVGPLLPVSVPEIVAVGERGLGYPERWSVVRWIDGDVPTV